MGELGVMAARGILENPAMFSGATLTPQQVIKSSSKHCVKVLLKNLLHADTLVLVVCLGILLD